MPIAIEPRPLTTRERAVAELILGLDFSGATELRAQLDFVRVVARWGAESASVDLETPPCAPRSPVPDGIVPVDTTVVDASGQLFGEIILWVTDGRLSAIEYAWYGDEPPNSLPSTDRVSTEPRGL
ncbi:hypothetical protein ABZT08_31105 [Streptomyces sp. NPDC005526]|uniref:hypothetical protein n=1 Tax=Streptomyces sp. NPDC005526 TaxID=3156885 RepID=UPI0033B80A8D